MNLCQYVTMDRLLCLRRLMRFDECTAATATMMTMTTKTTK